MLEVFVSHSRADRDVALRIAARLEEAADAAVCVDEIAGGSIWEAWEGGLGSAAILLVLSPDSVPRRADREAWQAALDHAMSRERPPLGVVLVRDCPYPRLLERLPRFFRWADDSSQALRAIQSWVMSLRPPVEPRAFVPAPQPWFEGREREMEALWSALADRCGTAVLAHPAPCGKTSLAQEFARRASPHYRDIVWIACGDRTAASIAGELAEKLGVPSDCDEQTAYARIASVLAGHRVLVALDNVVSFPPLPDEPARRASVLITTRSGELALPAETCAIAMSDLPPGPAVEPPSDPADLRLWRAMATCRSQGFPLELAVEVAGLSEAQSGAACSRLISQRLADPCDDSRGLLRLNEASRNAALSTTDCGALRRRHAEVLREAFRPSGVADRRPAYLAEASPAFQWAARADWPLATALAELTFAFLRSRRRLLEAVDIYAMLLGAARERQDAETEERCLRELSWLRDVPDGRIRPASPGEQLELNFTAAG